MAKTPQIAALPGMTPLGVKAQTMTDKLTTLDKLLTELESNGRLEAYAATEAARVLVDNWKAAIRDGHANPADLTNDVGETVSLLRDFERQAYKLLSD